MSLEDTVGSEEKYARYKELHYFSVMGSYKIASTYKPLSIPLILLAYSEKEIRMYAKERGIENCIVEDVNTNKRHVNQYSKAPEDLKKLSDGVWEPKHLHYIHAL